MKKQSQPKHADKDMKKTLTEIVDVPRSSSHTKQDVLKISINRIANMTEFEANLANLLTLLEHAFDFSRKSFSTVCCSSKKAINVPFEAQVRIFWKGDKIFESDKFTVETDGDTDLNFEVVFQASIDNQIIHQQLLDNPFYIVLLGSLPSPTLSSKKSKKPTPKSGKKSAGPVETVIGAASLDVLSILMGSDSLQKNLSLHSEKLLFGSDIVTWPNLPYINIIAQPLLDFKSEENRPPENLMCIGLEGIYNFKCSTGSIIAGLSLPVSEQNEKHEQFLYSSVRWVDQPNEERIFKWANIPVEGCAANSKYQISEKTDGISNVMDISEEELQKICTAPRLEWNKIHRCWLSNYCQEYFEKQIARYHNVPIEFYMSNDELRMKMKNKNNEAVDIQKQHFIAYPDLSRLMFPGVTSTRVVTQLYSFTKKSFIERAGDKSMIVFDPVDQPSKEITPNSAKETTGKKNKTSSKNSSKVPEEEATEEESVPLQTKDGYPVFLVVQVVLLKPITPKRTEDEFIFDLKNLIPERIEKPISVKNAEKAYNDYCAAIKDAYNFIAQSFQMYSTSFHKNLRYDVFSKYLEDTGVHTKIKEHLKESVLDYIIYKIGLPQKFDVESVFQDFLASSYIKLVEDMHSTVTGSNFDTSNSGRSVICNYPSEVSSDILHIFSSEATEENDFEKSNFFLLKMIDMDFMSPVPWIKMTIFMLQQNQVDKAEYYAKEIISINIRNPIGLLLYAIILFLRGDFKASELFFQALTTLHPDFSEAWIAFHFFYIHLEMLEEGKIVLQCAEELSSHSRSSDNEEPISNDEGDATKDIAINDEIDAKHLNDKKVDNEEDESALKNQELIDNNEVVDERDSRSHASVQALKSLNVNDYFSDDILEPILSWFPELHDMDNVQFIKTAILLLNLRCFMFAEMCLNRAVLLSSNNETIAIIEYLLACSDYLQERPENTLYHLDVSLRFNVQSIPLHLLAGHCHYKMGNFEKMEESYSFVSLLSKTPNPFQLHLMYLRLGYARFIKEDYMESRTFYYKSCQLIRTPLSWLGIAKSCYMMESYEEAESCLSEANLLDCENGEIWSYLALVNHKMNCPSVFLDCYNQTKRFPFNNEALKNEIEELYYSFYRSNHFINRRIIESEEN